MTEADKRFGAGAIVVVAIGLFLLFNTPALMRIGKPANDAAITTPKASTPSDEIRDPATKNLMRSVVTKAGYDCESPNILYARGPSPFGLSFELWCGPAGTTSAYTHQRYAVFPISGRAEVCSSDPWKECPPAN